MPDFLTNPKLACLTLEFKPPKEGKTALEVANELLDEYELDEWRLRVVGGDDTPLDVDLVPPQDPMPSAEDAWQISHRLDSDSRVVYSDPSFEIDCPVDEKGDFDFEEGTRESTRRESPEGELEAFGVKGPVFSPNQYDWSVQFVEAPRAWELEPPGEADDRPVGKRFGEGIIVGHPDSGILPHDEVGSSLDLARGWDLIDDKEMQPETHGGSHGLGTASVIIAKDNRRSQRASVTGIAPNATLLPFRVAKRRRGNLPPSPVLFWSGADRLAEAIRRCIREEVHVISISLGWLKNKRLHKQIKRAVDQNIIVVAAAGNYTRGLVVWPAAYPEVIAIAGCDSTREKWSRSARGSRVSVTGPAKNVWKADAETHVSTSKGTSHATATVAGIASLWLAYHDRDWLLDRYQGSGIPLSSVFRRVLEESCYQWPGGLRNRLRYRRWGAGIVNAHRCLQMPLPSPDDQDLESFGVAEAPRDKIGLVQEALGADDIDAAAFRRRLAGVLDVPAQNLDEVIDGMEDEIIFWLTVDPDLREYIADDSSESDESEELETFGTALRLRSMSDTLREILRPEPHPEPEPEPTD